MNYKYCPLSLFIDSYIELFSVCISVFVILMSRLSEVKLCLILILVCSLEMEARRHACSTSYLPLGGLISLYYISLVKSHNLSAAELKIIKYTVALTSKSIIKMFFETGSLYVVLGSLKFTISLCNLG